GVLMGEDVDHTAHVLGFGKIETVNAALGDAGGDEIGVSRMGERHVRGILGASCHLGDAVIARHRLAHIRFRRGSGGRHRHTSIVAAWWSARATTRLPSAILKALCLRGTAPEK